MVLDAIVHEATEGHLPYDAGGRRARKGTVNRPLLTELMAQQGAYWRLYEAQARQEKAERDRMLEVDEAVLAADPPTSAMAGGEDRRP